MFYKVDNLEETLAMFNKQSTSRDSRFTSLNPYKWVDGGNKSGDTNCEASNKIVAR